ncbi:hypothetical protein OAE83_01770, partial [bacterium]|nr:hypothetical protein [bacterium]
AYAYFLRADAHKNDGDIERFISDAMQSHEHGEDNYISTYSLAYLGEGYFRKGDFKKSYDSYYKMHLDLEEEKHSEESPEEKDQMNDIRNELAGILGLVSTKMNDNQLTVKWLRKAIEQDHENKLQKMNLHKHLADALLELDETEDSLKAYYASDSYTNQAPVKLAIGKLLSNKGNFNKAIQYFTDSIKYDAKPHFVYFNRASAYIEIGEYQKAINDYSAMLAKTSMTEDIKLYYTLLMLRGLAYQQSRNWEQACTDFAEAISLGHPTANDYLLKFATKCIS